MMMLPIPFPLLTDSYKHSHFALYPPNTKRLVAYATFRTAFTKDPIDQRLIFYGIRHFVETYLTHRWTLEEVEATDRFLQTFLAPKGEPYPWPKHLFERFIRENDGYFPVHLQALPEGSVVYPNTPVVQLACKDAYAPLCTWLETLLCSTLWYPSTVATLSRRAKQQLQDAFDQSVDSDRHFLVHSKLHDFGMRGVTTPEQAVLGGVAHLLHFSGTDTLPAAYYAQMTLNAGKPIASFGGISSIPATEHSVMCAWATEKEAIQRLIETYGSGIYSCVMDTYNYERAINEILPTAKTHILEKGGFFVIRPDSGDILETVMTGLRGAERLFGADLNQKGYKVLRHASVIQGDGVTVDRIKDVLDAVMAAGYAAENVTFGMGGGLLQRVNRDTMSFATKISKIEFDDGSSRDLMKYPKTDSAKISLPGEFDVFRVSPHHMPMVFPKGDGVPADASSASLLETLYDGRPLPDLSKRWKTFDVLREEIETAWRKAPKQFDAVSPACKDVVQRVKAEIEGRMTSS